MNKMNNAPPKIAAKLRNNRPMANPFVCEYHPSVCSCNPVNEPFIGRNIPNGKLKLAMQRIHGFTLIELVVTIVVVSILAAVTVPNLRTFIQNARITTHVNDLISDLNYARSEAIKRRTNITVCQSTNGTTCTGGDWKFGHLIFADTDKDGALDAAEVVLRFRGADGGSDGTLVLAGPDPVFLASGITTGLTNFTICDDRGAPKGKTVTLNNTGQATVSRTAPTTCN